MTAEEKLKEQIEHILYDNDNYKKIEYGIGSAPWTEDPIEIDGDKMIPKLIDLIANLVKLVSP